MSDDHIVIDPYVFLVRDDTEERFGEFVEHVMKWGRKLLQQPEFFSTSEFGVYALMELGRYPTFEVLKEAFSKYPAIGVSAVDLANSVRRMAERRPYTEERLGLEGIWLADDVRAEPPEVFDRLPQEVANATRDAWYGVAVARSTGRSDENVAMGTCDLANCASGLTLTGSVELFVFRDGHEGENHPLSVNLPIRTSAESSDVNDDWTTLYLDPTRATQVIYDELKGTDPEIPKLKSVRWTAGFVESLEAECFHRKPHLLRRVFFLAANAGCGRLSNISGADLHPVRVNAAADAVQVKRGDGALLWRCRITKHGAGYRLHYWDLKGDIELDCVCVESKV